MPHAVTPEDDGAVPSLGGAAELVLEGVAFHQAGRPTAEP